tara:strand:- start:3246 stop:3503 length:258 start_codon:yes stop_codon:yes gene_type:complete
MKGFSNWETWNVLLWLDNDQELYKKKLRFVNLYINKKDFEKHLNIFLGYMFPKGTHDMQRQDQMKKVNIKEIANILRDEYENEEL